MEAFDDVPRRPLIERARCRDRLAAQWALSRPSPGLAEFAALISPGAGEILGEIARRSHRLTQRRFGKVIRLFAPLYVSNECINNCKYCGFSRDNPIVRVTLSVEEVFREGMALKDQGFRSLLLVAGEHPKFVAANYLEDCLRRLRPAIPSLSLEVGPMEAVDYRGMVRAGAEGLVVYQETYDRVKYGEMHTSGPKRNFDWRLATPERAYAAGFRRIGIGALLGLGDWRLEAICLAAHLRYLLRYCWKAQFTVSFPRLRPCAGEFEPLQSLSDRELVQLVCALRLCFPDVGIVLSTREPSFLRNGLIPLGVTLMSAGSHTEPGGYTGAGREHLHQTVRGRIQPLDPAPAESPLAARYPGATRQFDIADERSAGEVAVAIRALGYEPVWKDWDAVLLN